MPPVIERSTTDHVFVLLTMCPLEDLGSIKHVGSITSCWQKGGHVPGPVYHIVHVVLPTVSYAVSLSFILRHLCFRL